MGKPESPYGKKATLVAECVVTSSLGVEHIKSFDKAWHRMLEIGETYPPVKCKFVGFVRKD